MKITNYLEVVDMEVTDTINAGDLFVTGDMSIPSTISQFENTGSIYYDNATHRLYIYDGDTTTWYHATLTT
jgi:uncharacterized protein YaiI (UPF0178 family)